MTAIHQETIEDRQLQIEEALRALRTTQLPKQLEPLRYLAPEHMEPHVDLFDRERRRPKIRRDASAQYWPPESGHAEAVISYEPARPTRPSYPPAKPALAVTPSNAVSDEHKVRDLLAVLDRAEREPGMSFVALKKFRDQHLADQGLGWTESAKERDRILRQAIDGGLVLTARIPNPVHPAYPTTTIRLNRSHPDLVAERPTRERKRRFQPKRLLKGKPLSQTVLEDRR